MAWLKVDDKFHSSKKLASIPRRYRFQAAGLWVIAGSWVAGQGTDGFVPDYMIDVWQATPKTVQSLIDSGLWRRTQGGYEVHAWLEYNPSNARVEAMRESSKERMRRTRKRRADIAAGSDVEDQNVAPQHVQEVAEQRSNDVAPLPTRPNRSPNGDLDLKRSLVSNAKQSEDLFNEFWSVVPRKVAKQAARKAWDKAVKVADAQVIIEAMAAYRDDPNRADEFTKHPATWLNQGCWEDDPLPARGVVQQPSRPRNDLDEFLERGQTPSNSQNSGPLAVQPSLNRAEVRGGVPDAAGGQETPIVDAEFWSTTNQPAWPASKPDEEPPF